jgi:hypothetical protein
MMILWFYNLKRFFFVFFFTVRKSDLWLGNPVKAKNVLAARIQPPIQQPGQAQVAQVLAGLGLADAQQRHHLALEIKRRGLRSLARQAKQAQVTDQHHRRQAVLVDDFGNTHRGTAGAG